MAATRVEGEVAAPHAVETRRPPLLLAQRPQHNDLVILFLLCLGTFFLLGELCAIRWRYVVLPVDVRLPCG